MPLRRLLLLLVLWIIVSVTSCALIVLEFPPTVRTTPRRTHHP